MVYVSIKITETSSLSREAAQTPVVSMALGQKYQDRISPQMPAPEGESYSCG